MIKVSFRLLVSLSLPQRIVAIFTLLFPLFIHTLASWITSFTCGRNCLMIGPFSVIHYAVFSIWFVIAVILFAWVVSNERSDAKRHIDQNVNALSNQIESQGEEFRRITTGLQDGINDLQYWVSAVSQSLEKELEIKLPGPRISVRPAPASLGLLAAIASVNVVGQSNWVTRFRRRAKHLAILFWRLSCKYVWDWDQDKSNRGT